jgi:hypothetical protein
MLVATQGNSARTTRLSQAGHGTTGIKPEAQTADQKPELGNVADVMAFGDRSGSSTSVLSGWPTQGPMASGSGTYGPGI